MLLDNFRNATGESCVGKRSQRGQSSAKRYKNGRFDPSVRTTKQQLRTEASLQNPQRRLTQKTFTMRQSLMSITFAIALFFECYTLSAAVPMAKPEDSSLEQETLLLSDEAVENSLGEVDVAAAGRTRGPRLIVVADPNLWRELRELHSGLSLYKRRADDNSQVNQNRGAGQDLNIPILRRDTMRCMVGRVYRPCWEV
ncbi:uncharacterized protein V6R79_007882 [Siganus canaliculatus]